MAEKHHLFPMTKKKYKLKKHLPLMKGKKKYRIERQSRPVRGTDVQDDANIDRLIRRAETMVRRKQSKYGKKGGRIGPPERERPSK